MVLRMISSGYKVRGCPGSIPGRALKKEKSIHLIYILYILYVIYIVYILYAYYIFYILHIYVESKVSGIKIGLHLQQILGDPRDRWCYG